MGGPAQCGSRVKAALQVEPQALGLRPQSPGPRPHLPPPPAAAPVVPPWPPPSYLAHGPPLLPQLRSRVRLVLCLEAVGLPLLGVVTVFACKDLAAQQALW